jgi:hypothetical protein
MKEQIMQAFDIEASYTEGHVAFVAIYITCPDGQTSPLIVTIAKRTNETATVNGLSIKDKPLAEKSIMSDMLVRVYHLQSE